MLFFNPYHHGRATYHFKDVMQVYNGEDLLHFVWPVRDGYPGREPIPEPSTTLLVASGLAGFVGLSACAKITSQIQRRTIRPEVSKGAVGRSTFDPSA